MPPLPLSKEKGIPREYMMDKITQALISAYKRDHEGMTDNVFVDASEEKGEVRMFVKKDVVEKVDNPANEISLDEARLSLPNAQLGDVVRIEIKARNFGRIAAQTARQVIIQGMREAERGMIYEEFTSREHEMLTGVVTRVDPRSSAVSLRIGSGSELTDAYLAPAEQVRGEVIRDGDRLKVYVVEVRRSARRPPGAHFRTHPGLVKRLFELEVPEIYDGTVEVKSIAREAGSRTKLAVWSADPNVDPIGACVGPRGSRVNSVVEELRGEKVDIIKYSDDPAAYVAAALSPADVISVETLEEARTAAWWYPTTSCPWPSGRRARTPGGQAYRIQDRHQAGVRPPGAAGVHTARKKRRKKKIDSAVREVRAMPKNPAAPMPWLSGEETQAGAHPRWSDRRR